MELPKERGPLSAALFDRLRQPVSPAPDWAAEAVVARDFDPRVIIAGDDAQISLWALYELHYRSFEDVGDDHEWSPTNLYLRRLLETSFEAALRAETSVTVNRVLAAEGDLADRLFDLTATFEGPAVAEFVQRRASRDQIRELLMLRSVYHLKEADPHSWAIPRLTGAAKAALVELQFDEYGDGHADRVHQDLFRTTLRGVGLDDRYGAYIDSVPAKTLAVSNAMSLFGLHRRLRGAAMGHLGAFEATSSIPCRRYAAGLRRVGFGDEVALYFDEHVEADAIHEQLALRGICTTLVDETPELEPDVVFGAVACLALEAIASSDLLDAWREGRHLVRPPAEREGSAQDDMDEVPS